MPFVWKDGKRVEVDEAEIVQAVKDGSFEKKFGDLAQGGTVNVVGEGGSARSINFNPAALRHHISQGARFETPEEVEQARKKQEYGTDFIDEAKAGVLGGLRGATGGLSDVIVSGLGKAAPSIFPTREEIDAYRELNPDISTAGEIAGVVVPALMTAGGSAAAQTAARAGTMGLGKQIASWTAPALIESGTQKLAGALGASGIKALSAGGGLGAHIGARAIEGQVYGALSAADTAFLRNTDIAEELRSGMATGIVLGAAVPVVGAAGKYILGKAGERIAASAERRAAQRAAAAESVPGAAPGKGGAQTAGEAATEGFEAAAEKPTATAPGTKAQALDDLKSLDDAEISGRGLTDDEVEVVRNAKSLDDVPAATQAKLETEAHVEQLKDSTGWFGRAYAKVVGGLSSMSEPEILPLLQKGPKGKQIRHVAENADDVLEGLSRATAKTDTGFVDLLKRVAEHWRELKPDAMKKLISNPYSRETAETVAGELWDVSDDLGKMVEGGRGEFAQLAGTKHLKEIIDVQFGNLKKMMDDPNVHMADVFVAADNAKRQIGRFAAVLYRGGGALADSTGNQTMGQLAQATADAYTARYERLRKLLERSDLWGDAAAGAQKEVNRSWTGYLGWLRAKPKIQLYRPWAAKNKLHTSLWEMNFETDPGQLRALYEATSSTSGDLDWLRLMQTETLRNELIVKHIKQLDLGNKALWGENAVTAETIREAFGKEVFSKGGRFAHLAKVTDPVELVEKIFSRHMEQITSAKEIRKLGDLWKKARQGSSTLPLPDMVSRPGSMIGVASAMDRITGLGQEALRAISGAQKQSMESMSAAQRSAMDRITGLGQESLRAISGSQKQSMESMSAAQRAAMESIAQTAEEAGKATRTRSRVSAEAGRTMYDLVTKSKRMVGLEAGVTPPAAWLGAKPDKKVEDAKLEEFARDPAKSEQELSALGVDDLAPGAARVLGLLRETAPKAQPQFLLDQLQGKALEIDPYELQQWKRDTARIIRSPDAIMDLVAANELEPKHVALFAKAYPGLYEGLRSQIKVWLQQTKPGALSKSRIEQLGIFLGEPLTGDSDSAVYASAQAVYAQQRPQQQQGQGPAPGGGGKTLSAAKAKQLGQGIPQTFAGRIEAG
jgi:hypothetical protein